MSVRRIAFVFGLVSAGIVAPHVTSVSASSPLPVGAGEFVPTIDLGSALADLTNVPMTACKVGSSNISALSVGETFNLPASDPTKTLAVATGLKGKSDSLVSLDCSASMVIAGNEKEVTGTVVNDALSLSGSFTLKCTFKQSLTVQATLSLGLAVARGADVSVKSADKSIPVTCSMAASFDDGSTISGSVEGTAEVGSVVSDSCLDDTGVSCVPLAISADVEVASTTGKFAGYTGSGTFNLNPSSTLQSLNSNLSQLQSFIGKSSVRALRASMSVSSKEGAMRIGFTPGAVRAQIVHPAVGSNGASSFAAGSLMAAVGPRSAKCTYAVARGKKSVTVTSIKSSSTGVMPTRSMTKKQYTTVRKALSAKPGSTLTFVAACGKVRATQSVKLG